MLISTQNEIRLKLPAGEGKNDAKLARILGPLKINPAKFCTKFNELTTNQKGIKKGEIVVVGLIAKADKTFNLNVYGIDVSRTILKVANTQKGSQTPGHSNTLSLSKEQIIKIAEDKISYVKHLFNIESLIKSITATAKSCGIIVK